ncbi:MAG: hypothetical protein ABW032_04740, partial [Burkholderiaceae bacterium]
RLAGINELPDHEVRAGIMHLWSDSIPIIERMGGKKATRNRNLLLARYPLKKMVELCAHWKEPQALQGWLGEIDSGPGANTSSEERWLKVLGALKEKFPLEKNPRGEYPNLSRVKPLFILLLAHRDIAHISKDDEIDQTV